MSTTSLSTNELSTNELSTGNLGPQNLTQGIAVVGMAGRFPGASDIDTYWRNLREGVESIHRFSREELRASGVPRELLDDPNYVPAAPILDDVEHFDAAFFGISPREAAVFDPQHRLFLETAWQALEDAGYDPRRFDGPVGVFAGMHRSTYVLRVYQRPDLARSLGDTLIKHATGNDYLATRTAYHLDLKGPAITVQTTCSTSLVATHLACQSLLSGESDMALAGGVCVLLPQKQGYVYERGSMLSPDGHCRPFDEAGQGTLFGSGVGVVALRRLEDALEDGDRIDAIIRGTAINNDGSAKIGFTAPSIEGQAEVVRTAHALADVTADTVDYVEAHGTATPIGDPIEIAALKEAFGEHGGEVCYVGSVKSNFGHLDTAAGVAGLIKTVLAIKHGEIPPSLNFNAPNPKLGLESGPFRVPTDLTPWPGGRGPRRAGVSAFGVGGTNAHIVLEEAPKEVSHSLGAPPYLLLLSARSPSALAEAQRRLAEHLLEHPSLPLEDVAYTLRLGRQRFPHRRAVLAQDRQQAVSLLSEGGEGSWKRNTEQAAPPVIFLFPGQGTQHHEMAAGLYRSEPVFRRHLDRCAEILRQPLGLDLRELLTDSTAEAADRLRETRFAQPALFAVEYSLAQLWISFGVEPQGMIGHSIGEYVAATLAGVFSLEDALALVVARGRLMQALPPGGMLSVALSAEELEDKLPPELSLAAANAPALSVAAGPQEALDALAAVLEAEGVSCRFLHTSHAFHSAMMDPILGPFADRLAQIPLATPQKPFISNRTGTWITAEDATDSRYWADHLRNAVRFSEGVRVLLENPDAVFLVVGPGRAVADLVRQQPEASGRIVVPSMRHPKETTNDRTVLLSAVAKLWLAGVDPDWQAGDHRRVALPTYPFERQRCWIDGPEAIQGSAPVFVLSSPDDPLAEGLRSLGARVIRLEDAEGFEELREDHFRLDTQRPEDLRSLMEALGHAVSEPPGAEEVSLAAPVDCSTEGRPDLDSEYVAPASDIEEQLVAFWQQLLGVQKIGIHDSFFDLGGHSLLGTQLISRIRRTWGIDLPLSAIFEGPTVAALAHRIPANASPAREEGIPPVDRDQPLALSFAQQRLFFLEELAPGSPAYNLHGAVRLKGDVRPRYLEQSLTWLVDRHEILRTVYSADDGEPAQQVRSSPSVKLEVIDLRSLGDAADLLESEALAAREARLPFDLKNGPLLRLALVRSQSDQWFLLITVHHICFDGWSWGLFFRELMDGYEAAAVGGAAPRAALKVQYADFASWQRDVLAAGAEDLQMAYWRRRLAGPLPDLELPTDRPRPEVPTFVGAILHRRLPRTLSDGLSRLSQARETTLFMTLLAAYKVLLLQLTGEQDIVVGSPVAGRDHPDTEGLIGLFVNTLVLRTDLGGNPDFLTLLDQVKDRVLTATAHGSVPFERLVDELLPERRLGKNPFFQVWFVLHHSPDLQVNLPGIEPASVVVDSGVVRHDLSCTFLEVEGDLELLLEYRTELFDRSTIIALAAAFEAMLEILVADPEKRLDELGSSIERVREELRAERKQTLKTAGRKRLGRLRRRVAR